MSLDEIRDKYDISENDVEQVKSILREKIKENHPDNGKDTDIEYFTQLCEDFAYVGTLEEKKEVLVPVNEMLKTISEIMQVQTKNEINVVEKLSIKLNESVEKQIAIDRDHWKFPRYSSTGIAAFITFLWMFPNQVLEHPMMQMLFNGVFVRENYILVCTGIWLVSLYFAGVCWLWTSRIERREKEIMERIKLESEQNKLFVEFIRSIPSSKFSKLEFMEHIKRYIEARYTGKTIIRGIRRVTFHEEIVQNIADIILLRAKEMGTIKSIKAFGIVECYEIIDN